MRRIVGVLVCLVVLVTCAAVARAEIDPNKIIEDIEYGILPEELGGEPRSERSGGLIDNLLAAPLNAVFRAMEKLGMVEIRDLVFGGSEVGGIFTREQWRVVEAFRARFKVVAWLLLVLSVLITGIRVAFSGGKPAQRAGLAQFALDLFIAALLVEFMPMAFDLICDLNRGLVQLVADHISSADVWGVLDPTNIDTDSVILTGLARIAWMTIVLWFNILYMVRMFVVGVLYVLSPIVAWAWSLHNTKTPFFLAMSEMVSNVFMQGAHAVVLGFWAVLCAVTPTSVAVGGYKSVFGTWWMTMGILAIIIPVGGLVRNLVCGWMALLGVKEEQLAGGAALGIGGLIGLGTLAQSLGGVLAGRVAGSALTSHAASAAGAGAGLATAAATAGGLPPGISRGQPFPGTGGVPQGGGGPVGGGGGAPAGRAPGGGSGGAAAGAAAGTAAGMARVAGPAAGGAAGATRAAGSAAGPGVGAAAARAVHPGVTAAAVAGGVAGSMASSAAAYPVGAPASPAGAAVGEGAAAAAAARLLARREQSEGQAPAPGDALDRYDYYSRVRFGRPETKYG